MKQYNLLKRLVLRDKMIIMQNADMRRCRVPSLVFPLFLSLLILLCIHDASAQNAADEILSALNASNVSGGFLVYVSEKQGTPLEETLEALAHLDRFLVHALLPDARTVQSARRHLFEKDPSRRVTVAHWNGKSLPYADRIVNLLIENQGVDIEDKEIDRVLAPLGACVRPGDKGSGSWRVTTKAWPPTIDEWSHFLHDATNNAVARDVEVDPPFHVRWIGRPKWARHHNTLASVSALVSSRGRLFAIIDEGPTATLALPPQWKLVARDAFSGVILWTKEVDPWEGHLRPFRSGPSELSRRLVAASDRVFVTLGYGKPVVALDAATGKERRTYANTEGAVEILQDEEILYVVTGSLDQEAYRRSKRRGHPSPPHTEKRLLAFRVQDGECLWQRSDAETEQIYPTTLCTSNGKLYFQNPYGIHCLDARSGDASWSVEQPGGLKRKGWSAPTLIVHEDVLLSAERKRDEEDEAIAEKDGKIEWVCSAKPQTARGYGTLTAWDAETGKRLWSCAAAQGYNAPTDVFVADGLVWVGDVSYLNAPTFTKGRDPHTGKTKRTIDTSHAFNSAHHHRCYRNKATERYIVMGRTGTEFIPLTGERPFRNNWVRGTCQYGVLPCNGLLYAPPHSCACYIQSKLSGFWALAPKEESELISPSSGAERQFLSDASLARRSHQDLCCTTPSYAPDAACLPHPRRSVTDTEQTTSAPDLPVTLAEGRRCYTPSSGSLHQTPSATQPGAVRNEIGENVRLEKPSTSSRGDLHDWPTYRGNAARSGYTPSEVPSSLSRIWATSLGGRLTSPVMAKGVLCVAQIESHTVHALNAEDGQVIWEFIAGGIVDSPPTLYGGMAIFGCGDGSVYSLRLEDGSLLWRTRIAPADRRIIREGHVTSVWPVTGSILIHDDKVYCTAGLSSYLDGGLNFCWLDPWTGRILGEKRIYSRDPVTGEQPEHRAEDVEVPGAQPDVLACDGENLFLRDVRLSPEGEELDPTVKHLYSPVGFLDDHWWHRTYWIYGTEVYGRASGWHVAGNHIPSGRMLIDNGDALFGFGRKKIRSGDHALNHSSLHLFSCSKEVIPTGERGSIKNNNAALTRRLMPSRVQYHWSREIPVVARGMVLARDTLFVAGPVMGLKEDAADPSFDARSPAKLLMVSAADGEVFAEGQISSQPVFDGLIAADQALFLANRAGTVEKWSQSS